MIHTHTHAHMYCFNVTLLYLRCINSWEPSHDYACTRTQPHCNEPHVLGCTLSLVATWDAEPNHSKQVHSCVLTLVHSKN